MFAVFFFSSRRRHTRLQGDWSSDVCSSDLASNARLKLIFTDGVFSMEGDIAKLPDILTLARQYDAVVAVDDSRSEERRVGKSVDLGGRRIIKKKKNIER